VKFILDTSHLPGGGMSPMQFHNCEVLNHYIRNQTGFIKN